MNQTLSQINDREFDHADKAKQLETERKSLKVIEERLKLRLSEVDKVKESSEKEVKSLKDKYESQISKLQENEKKMLSQRDVIEKQLSFRETEAETLRNQANNSGTSPGILAAVTFMLGAAITFYVTQN